MFVLIPMRNVDQGTFETMGTDLGQGRVTDGGPSRNANLQDRLSPAHALFQSSDVREMVPAMPVVEA